LEKAVTLPYSDIPHFPTCTVSGHQGQLITGGVGGKTVVCQQGRFHYYEGHDFGQVTFAIRVFQILGVNTLLLTNAAGGIQEHLAPGDLCLITDHINAMGANPLRGTLPEDWGPRFPDMSCVYDLQLRQLMGTCARDLNLRLKEGVYLAVSGPSYETPAEISAFASWGADLVGMSTVPEAIVARHAGMRVCALSCVTNLAAGLGQQTLSHDEVKATADAVALEFESLVCRWISCL
jgi:purine-nucleoside phosphorylase